MAAHLWPARPVVRLLGHRRVYRARRAIAARCGPGDGDQLSKLTERRMGAPGYPPLRHDEFTVLADQALSWGNNNSADRGIVGDRVGLAGAVRVFQIAGDQAFL